MIPGLPGKRSQAPLVVNPQWASPGIRGIFLNRIFLNILRTCYFSHVQISVECAKNEISGKGVPIMWVGRKPQVHLLGLGGFDAHSVSHGAFLGNFDWVSLLQ